MHGPARVCFQGEAGQEPETRNFAQEVVPTIVKGALAAAIGALPEKRVIAGLAERVSEEVGPEAVALGEVFPELARPALGQVAVLEPAVVFVELSLELPAWSGGWSGVRLRHWSPVLQPARCWPAVRNLSPVGLAQWVVRCSIFSLQPFFRPL